VIVVDASALVEVLLQTETGTALQTRLLAPGETLHVPHLIDVEVPEVLRRLAATDAISSGRVEAALVDLVGFPLRRYPHDLLLRRIWQLRNNLTAYDATYVTLAEMLEAPLLTRDRRLSTAPGHQATILLV